jgi:hypothetical protein
MDFKPPRLPKNLNVINSNIVIPNGPQHSYTLENTHVKYQGYWAAVIDYNHPHTRDVMRDMRIECLPPSSPTDSNTMSKWGVRRYKITGIRERLWISGVWKEHCIYESPGDGNLVYRDLYLEDAGAQALQIRHTGNRNDPMWNVARKITIEDVRSAECGLERGAGRAGFSISVKDMGPLSDVVIRDLAVRTINQTAVKIYNNNVYDSFGAVCVEFCNSLDWRGGYVAMKNPDRTPVQLFDYSRKSARDTGPKHIKIRGVHMDLGNNISVRKCGESIDIKQCTGSGNILVYNWNGSDWKLSPTESRPIVQGLVWNR